MKNHSNPPIAPMFNASQLLENCGIFKPTRRKGWELSRKVPREILDARAKAGRSVEYASERVVNGVFRA